MSILASEVTKRLEKTLHDMGAVRWPLDEQYLAIDDAQNSLLEARPDLFEVTEDVQLQNTGVKQMVPANCYLVFDITYNLNTDLVPFSGITKINRGTLDRSLGGWMVAPESPRMEHWMQDIRERKFFWAYPPVSNDPDTGQPGFVVMRYAKRPVKITAPADELAVPDEMLNSVYYFSMTRLLEKDEKFAGSPQAESFLQKYALTVGARTKSDSAYDASTAANEGIGG